jgi:cytochrome c biogenesis protein CcmG/thiol:disulfide interchange protein DsbE
MTKAAPNRSGLTVVLVLVGAIVFGLVALPRFGGEPLVGTEPRDFALPRLETSGPGGAPGKPLKLSELAGKAVILDFWASWCLPCREQAPIVDRVARSLAPQGLVAVGVVTGDEPDAARRFLAKHPVRYFSVVDDQREASRAFGVNGLPTLVALDRTGRVVAVRRQLVREAELVEIAEQALAR